MQHEKWCLLLLEGTITADICGMLASKQIIVSCKCQIYMHVLMYILFGCAVCISWQKSYVPGQFFLKDSRSRVAQRVRKKSLMSQSSGLHADVITRTGGSIFSPRINYRLNQRNTCGMTEFVS